MKDKNPYIRPSWDEYFINITDLVGSRGTCDRGRAGCVIVRDKRIIATGYVGSPSGISHCDEVGHEMNTVSGNDGKESRHCVRTTHAEQNAICQAAKFGISLDGSTLYCKMTPCYICAKMIINAGIKSVVCARDYHKGIRTKEIFAEAGVKFKLLSGNIISYPDMEPEKKMEHDTIEVGAEKVEVASANHINDDFKEDDGIKKEKTKEKEDEEYYVPIKDDVTKEYHSLKDLINSKAGLN